MSKNKLTIPMPPCGSHQHHKFSKQASPDTFLCSRCGQVFTVRAGGGGGSPTEKRAEADAKTKVTTGGGHTWTVSPGVTAIVVGLYGEDKE